MASAFAFKDTEALVLKPGKKSFLFCFSSGIPQKVTFTPFTHQLSNIFLSVNLPASVFYDNKVDHSLLQQNRWYLSIERRILTIAGKGGQIVDRGDNTYGGKWVINPSGGLISKGHPLGATGIN